jgi:hypothetical protein
MARRTPWRNTRRLPRILGGPGARARPLEARPRDWAANAAQLALRTNPAMLEELTLHPPKWLGLGFLTPWRSAAAFCNNGGRRPQGASRYPTPRRQQQRLVRKPGRQGVAMGAGAPQRSRREARHPRLRRPLDKRPLQRVSALRGRDLGYSHTRPVDSRQCRLRRPLRHRSTPRLAHDDRGRNSLKETARQSKCLGGTPIAANRLPRESLARLANAPTAAP